MPDRGRIWTSLPVNSVRGTVVLSRPWRRGSIYQRYCRTQQTLAARVNLSEVLSYSAGPGGEGQSIRGTVVLSRPWRRGSIYQRYCRTQQTLAARVNLSEVLSYSAGPGGEGQSVRGTVVLDRPWRRGSICQRYCRTRQALAARVNMSEALSYSAGPGGEGQSVRGTVVLGRPWLRGSICQRHCRTRQALAARVNLSEVLSYSAGPGGEGQSVRGTVVLDRPWRRGSICQRYCRTRQALAARVNLSEALSYSTGPGGEGQSVRGTVVLGRPWRDEFDITHEFTPSIAESTSGQPGLQVVNYEVSLVKTDFLASLDQVGQNLKCHARVRRRPEFKRTATAVIDVKCKYLVTAVIDVKCKYLVTAVIDVKCKYLVTAVIDVKYAPHFHCANQRTVFPEARNYEVDCVVQSNPTLQLDSVYWSVGDNATFNVSLGQTVAGLMANATVESTYRLRAVLTIAEVNLTSLQTYRLVARNSLGERRYEIVLSEVSTTQSTTTVTERPGVKASVDDPRQVRSTTHVATALTAVVVVAVCLSVAASQL
ncbi:hypothetical protein LSAT2_009672 [Lamellibrachia satsuma]|nr:hypothetical protein LSAT2_009672 [Lamellibrachia satsuma]